MTPCGNFNNCSPVIAFCWIILLTSCHVALISSGVVGEAMKVACQYIFDGESMFIIMILAVGT